MNMNRTKNSSTNKITGNLNINSSKLGNNFIIPSNNAPDSLLARSVKSTFDFMV